MELKMTLKLLYATIIFKKLDHIESVMIKYKLHQETLILTMLHTFICLYMLR